MDAAQIWKEYQKGREYLSGINLFNKTEQCFNFVNGDQWNGLKYGAGERPPQLNILEPIMKNAVSLVGQNVMDIQYTSMNYGRQRKMLLGVCELLTDEAKKLWERLKMDTVGWNVLQDAFIAGDAFLYFYDDINAEDGRILCEPLISTNVMLADEQQPDIQKQKYVLIVQRKTVDEAKEMAREYGLPEDEISNIVADNDTELQVNGKTEVDKNSKLLVIAKLWKQDGVVHIARATRTVLIQPDTVINGMTRYPVAKFSWKVRKGLARGDGDIWDKIPNQISINKALFRLEQAIKASAYPVKAYREKALTPEQVKKLNQPGRAIAVSGNPMESLNNLLTYIQPANISPQAASYWQELIKLTRELAGAGDNLENVNPEQASGEAIRKALEAKEINVNNQVAAYRQFIEDIAWIWFEMTVAYNPNGLTIHFDQPDEYGQYSMVIPVWMLQGLDVDIKVDAIPSSHTHKAIKDSQLKDLLNAGMITFEEYVDSLGDDSTMPVEMLRKIIQARREAMAAMPPVINPEVVNNEMQNM